MASSKKAPLIAAAVVGVLAIGGIKLATGGGSDETLETEGKTTASRSSEGCESVVIAASSEKAGLMGEIADQYNSAGRKVDGTCFEAVVTTVASGSAQTALAEGWDEKVHGAKPTVWSPAASTWVGMLKQDLMAADKPNILPEKSSSIVTSPLVLAMPKPMAEALGWPKKQLGWGDVHQLATNPAGWGSVGHPEWGKFTLGKTNPNISTSGLAATVGAFYASTGRASDLTAKDLTDKKVLKYVQDVESAVVHYGDTTLTFLSNLAKADRSGKGMTYVSAVAVEEKSVIDYNLGNPTGDPTTLKDARKPQVPLVAIYPKEGTLVSDSPYVVLDADWVSETQKKGAADIEEFMKTPASQKTFTDAGFRAHDGAAGKAIKDDSNLSAAKVKSVINAPSASVLNGVRSTWAEVRKPARVLMLMDVSGSMGDDSGHRGKSKLELAKEAAAGALDQFTAHDEVGLWAFTTGMAGGETDFYSELMPLSKLDQANSKKLTTTLNGLIPLSGTPLYAATRAAAATMKSECADGYICAVVVLTDGRNEDMSDNDLDSLLEDLGGGSSENALRVFSIAYGDGADLDTLKQISEASSAAAYDSRDASKINKVFIDVLSNF
ncbi:substrate-binding and vWA domain-containing protein [Nocardioides jishulii]|nr:substrate-binding and VWA domain-containing protein [Nocardioides jishulii]